MKGLVAISCMFYWHIVGWLLPHQMHASDVAYLFLFLAPSATAYFSYSYVWFHLTDVLYAAWSTSPFR